MKIANMTSRLSYIFLILALMNRSILSMDNEKSLEKAIEKTALAVDQVPNEIWKIIESSAFGYQLHIVSRKDYAQALNYYNPVNQKKIRKEQISQEIKPTTFYCTDKEIEEKLLSSIQDHKEEKSALKKLSEWISKWKNNSCDQLYTIENSDSMHALKLYKACYETDHKLDVIKLCSAIYIWGHACRVYFEKEKNKEKTLELADKKYCYLSGTDYLAYHSSKLLFAVPNENNTGIDVWDIGHDKQELLYSYNFEKQFCIYGPTGTSWTRWISTTDKGTFRFIFDKYRPYLYALSTQVIVMDFENKKEYIFENPFIKDQTIHTNSFLPMNIVALGGTEGYSKTRYFDLDQKIVLPENDPKQFYQSKIFRPSLQEYDGIDKIIGINAGLIQQAEQWNKKNDQKTTEKIFDYLKTSKSSKNDPLREGRDIIASLKALGQLKYIIIWTTTDKEKKFNLFKTIHEKLESMKDLSTLVK